MPRGRSAENRRPFDVWTVHSGLQEPWKPRQREHFTPFSEFVTFKMKTPPTERPCRRLGHDHFCNLSRLAKGRPPPPGEEAVFLLALAMATARSGDWRQSFNAIAVPSTDAPKRSSWCRIRVTRSARSAELR